MILALDGMLTLLPTASILPSRIRMVWLVRTVPESGSISLPARIAVTWAGAGICMAQQAAVSIRQARTAAVILSHALGLVNFFLPTRGLHRGLYCVADRKNGGTDIFRLREPATDTTSASILLQLAALRADAGGDWIVDVTRR